MTWNQSWVNEAVCATVDPELFFPDKAGAKAFDAKRVCRVCPVQAPCLEWALENNEVGIWAGTSENQRRMLRRERGMRLPNDHRSPIEHGTNAGARAHYRAGEKPCAECEEAALQYGRRLREARA